MKEEENLKRMKEAEKQLRLVIQDTDDTALEVLCHQARQKIQSGTVYVGDEEGSLEYRVFRVLEEDAEKTEFNCPHCGAEEVYEKADWRACNNCLKWWTI